MVRKRFADAVKMFSSRPSPMFLEDLLQTMVNTIFKQDQFESDQIESIEKEQIQSIQPNRIKSTPNIKQPESNRNLLMANVSGLGQP